MILSVALWHKNKAIFLKSRFIVPGVDFDKKIVM